jgi:FecR protein
MGRLMAISRWLATVSSLALASAFALGGASAQGTGKIGVASAVSNRVESVVGGGARPLSVGGDVFARQMVRTGDASTAQLLFLDETSLSIGPSSEVTLDRFVYDPNRGAGNVVLSATKGAFRFVSGSQQPSSYQIRTPVATIGVRGTVFDTYITQRPQGAQTPQGIAVPQGEVIVVIVLVEGSLTAGGHTLTRAGEALIFGPKGVQKVTWDSTLFAVVKKMPFPLFGRLWPNDPYWNSIVNNPIDRLDQTSNSGPTFVPPNGCGNF